VACYKNKTAKIHSKYTIQQFSTLHTLTTYSFLECHASATATIWPCLHLSNDGVWLCTSINCNTLFNFVLSCDKQKPLERRKEGFRRLKRGRGRPRRGKREPCLYCLCMCRNVTVIYSAHMLWTIKLYMWLSDRAVHSYQALFPPTSWWKGKGAWGWG